MPSRSATSSASTNRFRHIIISLETVTCRSWEEVDIGFRPRQSGSMPAERGILIISRSATMPIWVGLPGCTATAEGDPSRRREGPNAFGLYDMYGNVWEWCWDRFGNYTAGLSLNPIGPDTGKDRIVRGHGWFNGAYRECRPSARGYGEPEGSCSDYGFRVAAGDTGGLPTITRSIPDQSLAGKLKETPAFGARSPTRLT